MGYFFDAARAMAMSLKSAFRKPTTIEYPFEKRDQGPRARLTFALVHDEHEEEACVGCLMCQKICPSQVITVVPGKKRPSEATGKKRGFADDFVLDMNACIYCELCVQVCPTDAIVMTQEHMRPGFAREDLVLTMDKLYANEQEKELSWGRASILLAMQDPKRGTDQERAVTKKKSAAKAATKPKPEPKAEVKADEPKADTGPTEDAS
ncbi:MAG: NADH-quinone oxidoreductase subunit I [Deltaproteobacteria bacterium]|nr:NADH-quinone oxidoreductase subunit I [Deltaproteobacteria bacterium]